MRPAIETRGLRKVYVAASGARRGRSGPGGPRPFGPPPLGGPPRPAGDVIALAGLDLEVAAGECFGLLGPNGAGKTTTIGILTTRVLPTAGEARVAGADVVRDGVRARRHIGVVPQRPNPDRALTVEENLLFHAAYYGLDAPTARTRSRALLEQFGIADKAAAKVDALSGGQQQRLMIARALIHEPAVLFLDEPTVGLDPQARLALWDVLRELRRGGRTVVRTTHYMEEADQLCDRLAIVDRGQLLALDTPGALRGRAPGGTLLELTLDGPAAPVAERVTGGAGVLRREAAGATLRVYAEQGGAALPGLLGAAEAAGRQVRDIRLVPPSLESLIIALTGRALSGARAPTTTLVTATGVTATALDLRDAAAPAPARASAFAALMRRDLRALTRELPFFLLRTILQPLLFVVVFGAVMPRMGLVARGYGAAMLPGVLALTLGLAAVQSVALPLVQDFGWTREIEDRLLAPIPTGLLVAQKVASGALQALVAASVVLPIARLVMGPIAGLSPANLGVVLLVAVLGAVTFSAAGLVLGTAIQPQQIGLLFSAVITPTVFFGCAYYPWRGLDAVPVMKYLVLLNPLTYVAEGMRAVLTPGMPHMPLAAVVGALSALAVLFCVLGARGFRKRAFG